MANMGLQMTGFVAVYEYTAGFVFSLVFFRFLVRRTYSIRVRVLLYLRVATCIARMLTTHEQGIPSGAYYYAKHNNNNLHNGSTHSIH